jgi:tripartite-type tricarboxylate transporter receptor subunit TctC
MRDLLGANIKVVSGYKGTSDVRLAMESGEIDGIMNSWESSKVTSLDRIKNGDWQILAQLGDNPVADLPVKNVPTIPQIAKSEEQRQLLRFGAAAPNQFGKVYVVSPGTPPERGAALETALTRTFADKEFLAEAEKGKLDIDPVSAQHVQKLINDFFGLPAELKAKLKKILRP